MKKQNAQYLQIAALLGAFVIGFFLRIRYYANGFSFFMDECALALNLEHRGYADLSRALEYDQAAPLGFLYLIKGTLISLGTNDYTLRLMPLIFGCGAMIAFYALSRQMFSGWVLVAANLLMAVNQTAISYSAQAKQYSLELLVAILMLLLSSMLFRYRDQPKILWIIAVTLGLLPWFSFTSIFMLVGIGFVFAIDQTRFRRKQALASAVKAYAIHPSFIDEPREALQFVSNHWQAGDRLYATRYATPCVVHYGQVFNSFRSDATLNVFAIDGRKSNPDALSTPVLVGRDWLVEMRTDWEPRGESVPVHEYFAHRGRELENKNMEWTSVTLYNIH